MKNVRVGLVLSVVLLASLSAAAHTEAAPHAGQCIPVQLGDYGHPGCRVIEVRCGHFQVPQIVVSGPFWLEFTGDPAQRFLLVAYHEGQFTFSSWPVPGFGSGFTFSDPGNWVLELRIQETNELLDTLELRLR